ncbi:hypothetical protein GCM10010967_32760 [Dyadobacter beijingensis]|uniref:Oligosaccharide repeat unit polymerase n=1 Tax=Dyadobacter beijingensis TaxID=365489 RepID=A0ABQ2I3F2_9BACT|nr:hypothetical protein [Dyadobacter beijingensis]GGM96530.1 hypothetical protein GCM10010967_32760 [Dyadobacter beijingensis]
MATEFFVGPILDNWLKYGLIYAAIVCLYLFLYRKIYWNIFDPMFLTVLNLSGSAFCVYFLYADQSLKPVYGWSFLGTEIALIAGLFLSKTIPALRIGGKVERNLEPEKGITEFDIFCFIMCMGYFVIEIINLKTVGIVLLDTENNHVSAYGGHGIIRAFLVSFRTLVTLTIYYKILFLKQRLNAMELFICFVLLVDLATSGSKSAIVVFFTLYFLTAYPLSLHGHIKQVKISWPLILALASFPVIVVMVSVGASPESALQQVGLRFMASGDVFLLGYYDDVMASIQETSFLKYAFYPGWGTILKNLGFEIIPPEPVGVDVFAFYSNSRLSGANGRYNYLAYHFFGLWGGFLYAFIIGLIVGYMREVFVKFNPKTISYFGFIFMVTLISCSSRLIDDLLLFGNTCFWALFFLIAVCVAAKLTHLVLKALAPPVVPQGQSAA